MPRQPVDENVLDLVDPPFGLARLMRMQIGQLGGLRLLDRGLSRRRYRRRRHFLREQPRRRTSQYESQGHEAPRAKHVVVCTPSWSSSKPDFMPTPDFQKWQSNQAEAAVLMELTCLATRRSASPRVFRSISFDEA